MLGAEVLSKVYSITGEEKYRILAQQAVNFTVAHQKSDGRWNYSIELQTNVEREQIDFHQGYVLESLLRLSQYSQFNISSYDDKIQNGLKYYYENQFNKEGWAYWRLPSKWPVDIHNQSQGIISFSNNYLPFAIKVAEWSIKNMQGPKGNFYYQKWPFLNNKVNYMRWNQAWMLLALATLIYRIKRD